MKPLARLLLLGSLVNAFCFGAQPEIPASSDTNTVASARFFTNPVHRIQVEISPGGLAELRRDSRKYVQAIVREGGVVHQAVGVHLKGSTGSFRGVDDKPAFTLNFARFTPEQRFHGLRKIHLNNSVEDPSFLNERLGTEFFRAAGVPAPRVAWALVELNGRRLGLYVLKEGFTEDFLALHFKRTDGELYEASPGDPDPGAAASLPLQPVGDTNFTPASDPIQRWTRVEQTLDVDRFLSFMAVEVMIGHRDGYGLARNNYRIYHDPESGRMVFLPHGMDVLFGKADAPLFPHFAGLAAQAVMETSEGRRRYRERFGFLLTNVFNVPALTAQADQWATQLRPVLTWREARALNREVAVVKERLAARHANLVQQFNTPELKPLFFGNGVATLGGWTAYDEPAGGKLDRAPAPDGKAALHIHAGPATMASWRTKARLGPGQFRFEGAVCLSGVVAPRSAKNQGAGLRVTGAAQPPHRLTGDQVWTPLRAEFEVVGPEREVELICELRATHGDAWFETDSLRVVRRR